MIENNIITTPINAEDPYRLLGIGPYNGWWDIGYICSNKHGRIKPWAKYKPIIFDNPSAQCQFPTEDGYFENLWRGDATSSTTFLRQNGFLISKLKDNIHYDTAANDSWIYEPPTEGFGKWSRLRDFHNYYHGADCPYIVDSSFQLPSRFLDVTGGLYFSIYMKIGDRSFDSKRLFLKDFEGMKDCYVFVMIHNTSKGIEIGPKASVVKLDALVNDTDSVDIDIPYSDVKFIEGGDILTLYIWASPSLTNPFYQRKSIRLYDSIVTYKTFEAIAEGSAPFCIYTFGDLTELKAISNTMWQGYNLYTDKNAIATYIDPYVISLSSFDAGAYLTKHNTQDEVYFNYVMEEYNPSSSGVYDPIIPKIILARVRSDNFGQSNIYYGDPSLEYKFGNTNNSSMDSRLAEKKIPIFNKEGTRKIKLHIECYVNGVKIESTPSGQEYIFSMADIIQ